MNEFDELLEGEKQRMDLERKSLEILFPRVFYFHAWVSFIAKLSNEKCDDSLEKYNEIDPFDVYNF